MGGLSRKRKVTCLFGLCLALVYIASVSSGLLVNLTGQTGEPLYRTQALAVESAAGRDLGHFTGEGEFSKTFESTLVQDELRREIEWLVACQTSDGAIALTPAGKQVVPYFANLAARTLIVREPGRVRLYMNWYLDRVNRPDHYGFAGTIYDYYASGNTWIPTYGYDSADSYAATFLSLAFEYLEKTGDSEFIISRFTDLEMVAQVLLALQDKDGLTFVMPKSKTKYLMDNCEVYRGLSDWSSALFTLERFDLASVYSEAAERVRSGIETVLYSPSRGEYAHTSSWYGKRYPKTGRWYPDAVSQLFLVTEGVISPHAPYAQEVWREFNAQFPRWIAGQTPDTFPWAKVAMASLMMGDSGRASAFLEWVAEEYGQTDRGYPWYVLESATVVDICRLIYPGVESVALADQDGDPEAQSSEDATIDSQMTGEIIAVSEDTAGSEVAEVADDVFYPNPRTGSVVTLGVLATP